MLLVQLSWQFSWILAMLSWMFGPLRMSKQLAVHYQRKWATRGVKQQPDWEGHYGVGGSITDPRSEPDQEVTSLLRHRQALLGKRGLQEGESKA